MTMKLYLKFFAINLKGRMQYKASFFMTLTGNFVMAFSSFWSVFFLLSRFHTVKGFTQNEVLLCYSVVSVTFFFSECFFRSFHNFSGVLSSARFDRILLFPRSPAFMTLCNDIEIFRLARLLQGMLIFIYALLNCPVDWTFLKGLTVSLMMLSGTVLYSAFFVLEAGICFFTTDHPEALNIFSYGTKEFAIYPLGIFGKGVLRIFTYIFPLALVQYYPLLYVVGKSDNVLYCFLPVLACLFVVPAAIVWRAGIRRYKSTGS